MSVIEIASVVRRKRISTEADEPSSWPKLAEDAFGMLSMSVLVNGQFCVHRIRSASVLVTCRTGGEVAAVLRSCLFDDFSFGNAWCVSLPPIGPAGFGITMHSSAEAAAIAVDFGGLVETVSCLDVALNLVGRALVGDCQLRVVCIGRHPRQWFLEPVSGGPGEALLSYGLGLTFSLFQERTVSVRRNEIASIEHESSAGAEWGQRQTSIGSAMRSVR